MVRNKYIINVEDVDDGAIFFRPKLILKYLFVFTLPLYAYTTINIYLPTYLCIGPTAGANDSRIQELTVEKGTIHTKRHSGEDPIKNG